MNVGLPADTTVQRRYVPNLAIATVADTASAHAAYTALAFAASKAEAWASTRACLLYTRGQGLPVSAQFVFVRCAVPASRPAAVVPAPPWWITADTCWKSQSCGAASMKSTLSGPFLPGLPSGCLPYSAPRPPAHACIAAA